MSSEIGNKRLMRTLAAALGILDVKQAPGRLDTSDVKVIAGLDIGSASIEPIHKTLLGPPSIVGETGYTWNLVGDDGGDPVFAGDVYYQRRADRHVIITDWFLQVQYTVAGIAADADTWADVFTYRMSADNFSFRNAGVVQQAYYATNPIQYYNICFPWWQTPYRSPAANNPIAGPAAGQSIFVPAGEGFSLTISHVPIAVWPAGTVLHGQFNGYAIPVGCKIPWM